MSNSKKSAFGHNQSDRESHLLPELLHVHQALMNLFSREVGISPAKLKLFHEFLHDDDQGGIGLSDLALRLGVTPALVTRQVQELESEGLLERRLDPRDGRRSYIHLSEKGKTEIIKIHERAHQFETALLEGMNPNDVAVAVGVLSNLTEKMKNWRRTGRYLLDKD